jgi:hypothetical protein
MDPQTLEKILHCPSLPSLPVIAAKVIELTSKADVKMDELAELIQKDQLLLLRASHAVRDHSARPCDAWSRTGQDPGAELLDRLGDWEER